MLNKLVLLTALVYSSVLVYLSLENLKNIPEIGIHYADRIFHFLAYGLLSLLWFIALNYNVRCKRNIAIYSAAIFSIIFGIIIEVLQHTITTYRSLDIFDIIANTAGVIAAVVLLTIKKNIGIKKM